MGALFSGPPKPPAPPPPPPPPPVMPMPDDDAIKAAKRRKLAEQVNRSGRLSTVLADSGTGSSDALGG